MPSVQILGTAPNVSRTPDTDGERWCINTPRSYRRRGLSKAATTYTRWFNFHTLHHIQRRYPETLKWYEAQEQPIYLQHAQPTISASVTFPRDAVQRFFAINGTPNRFFTCSAAWLIAFAIIEGFDDIELWGFELRRDANLDWERPCFFYWVGEAVRRGINVHIPPDVDISLPGNPVGYDGPLYGYEPHSEFYKDSFGPIG